MLQTIAKTQGMNIVTTEDSLMINDRTLSHTDVLIFLSTSGNVLDSMQQAAVQKFIQSGKGFVGIHGAAATEYDWAWYGELVGRFFVDHPQVQQAKLNVVNHNHPASHELPSDWVTKDEWYNFKTPIPPHLTVLMTLDESSYEGGTMGSNHALTWFHEFDGGRSFYTALGHTEETYKDSKFQNIILGAIQWAAGIE